MTTIRRHRKGREGRAEKREVGKREAGRYEDSESMRKQERGKTRGDPGVFVPLLPPAGIFSRRVFDERNAFCTRSTPEAGEGVFASRERLALLRGLNGL